MFCDSSWTKVEELWYFILDGKLETYYATFRSVDVSDINFSYGFSEFVSFYVLYFLPHVAILQNLYKLVE